MIDIKALEKNEQVDGLGRSYSETYRESLKNRGEDGSLVDQLLSLNSERKALVTQAEQARAEQNRVGLEIAKRKRAGENADVLLSEMQKLSSQIKEMTELSVSKEAELNEKLSRLPNICHHSVPIG